MCLCALCELQVVCERVCEGVRMFGWERERKKEREKGREKERWKKGSEKGREKEREICMRGGGQTHLIGKERRSERKKERKKER